VTDVENATSSEYAKRGFDEPSSPADFLAARSRLAARHAPLPRANPDVEPFDSGAVVRLRPVARSFDRSSPLAGQAAESSPLRRAEFDALDLLGVAALMLDASARVTSLNRAAETLACDGALRLTASRMRCPDQAARARFDQAILAAAAGRRPDPVSFRDPNGAVHAMCAAPVGAAARRAVVVYVYTGYRDAGPSPKLLEALYELTPAEARVAAELALGDGEAAAARRLGVSVNSVKTHRRRVFEKVGVQRLAQLVRLLARLPSAN
jgi:DNA-binding CsgD family transcriptional regulator